MVDVQKRYPIKSWKMHDETKMVKHQLYDAQLPEVKPIGELCATTKQRVPRPSKRDGSHYLPSIANSSSTESFLENSQISSSTTQLLETSTKYNSAVQEAAKRFILRNNMARLAREVSSMNVTGSSYLKRKTLYDHIQPKINTGLPRITGKNIRESDNYKLGPAPPVNWFALKTGIEKDVHISEQTKRMEFDSDDTHKAELLILGNLIRSKVKHYLSSIKGGSAQRYKIVVHLTVFQKIPAGLHVASRCLWDTRTDNSVTINMQGVDCDILVVVFLCHTDVGGI